MISEQGDSVHSPSVGVGCSATEELFERSSQVIATEGGVAMVLSIRAVPAEGEDVKNTRNDRSQDRSWYGGREITTLQPGRCCHRLTIRHVPLCSHHHGSATMVLQPGVSQQAFPTMLPAKLSDVKSSPSSLQHAPAIKFPLL